MAAAVVAAMRWTPGDRVGLLLPIAIVAGLGLSILAVARFEIFLLVVIVIRASLDVAKLTSSSVDATGAISVLFIGATLVWLLRHDPLVAGASPVRGLLAPLTALLVVAAVGIVFSTHPLESALEVVRIGTVVVIVIALGRVVRSWQQVRAFVFALFASSIVPLGFASLQIARGGAGLIGGGIGRVNATFQHPNPFGAYLFLILVLGVALIPYVPTIWKWALGALLIAESAVLVTTYARGAWVAALVGLIVVAVLQSRWLFWVMGVAAIVIVLAVPTVGLRLADLSETRAESGAPANSLVWRIEYWKQVLELQDNPLLGIGLREVQLREQQGAPPHNDFVRLYVETGLVGLAAYLWFFGALFRDAVRAYRRAAPGLARGLTVAFLAATSGLVVLSVAANVISQLVILWYFVSIGVIALVASRLDPDPSPTAA